MSAHQAVYHVKTMCRVLDVSTSGYYAWRRREASAHEQADKRLTESIRGYHTRSRGTYGAPRVHADLAAADVRVSRKRVARLMRQAGLVGVSRRKGPHTTVRQPDARPAEDLVGRDFAASGPDQLWIADITYIPTLSGFLYLAVVLDAFSRRVVGWSMANHLRTEIVLDALGMALGQRRPEAVIHHSDHGCQYTSVAFGQRCRQAGVRPSMGSVGDCYDNAMCESFFATLECELLDRSRFPNQAQARIAVFDYIEGWYNRHRRHSALSYLSPVEFEAGTTLSPSTKALTCPPKWGNSTDRPRTHARQRPRAALRARRAAATRRRRYQPRLGGRFGGHGGHRGTQGRRRRGDLLRDEDARSASPSRSPCGGRLQQALDVLGGDADAAEVVALGVAQAVEVAATRPQQAVGALKPRADAASSGERGSQEGWAARR